MKADLIWILRTPEYGGDDRPRDKIEAMRAKGVQATRMSYDPHRPADTYLEGWFKKPDDMGPRPWEDPYAGGEPQRG